MGGNIFDDADIIDAYPLEQAIEDGVLVEIFKERWSQLSGGKPIVVTSHLFNGASEANPEAALIDIWNEFVYWNRQIKDTIPEEEQMFVTELDGQKVWVIEDGAAITMM